MRQTDRQTDHATEKCVGIGGIAGAARAIPPKNVSLTSTDSESKITLSVRIIFSVPRLAHVLLPSEIGVIAGALTTATAHCKCSDGNSALNTRPVLISACAVRHYDIIS